jgi:hypothetical protein
MIMKYVVLALYAFLSNAYAMEFTAVTVDKATAIVGVGPIIEGDYDRLVKITSEATVDETGFRILFLNSQGGSVKEAIRVAEVINSMKYQVIIAPGHTCASACGSILFIAADARVVAPTGRLGMHTCYDSNSGVPNQACNDAVANHAFSNGLHYGTIAGFTVGVSPDKMIWLSNEDAECWGLNRAPNEEENLTSPCVINMFSCSESYPDNFEKMGECIDDKYREWKNALKTAIRN